MRVLATCKASAAALLLAAMMMLLVTGCGGDSRADRLLNEADELRQSAADRLRRSTVATDSLISGAAIGESLPVNRTQNATATASAELHEALAELTLRDAKFREAETLELSDAFREYLAMLKRSNDQLSQTMNLALEIPTLLNQEQYTVAGWDEIKTEIIVSQIRTMQDHIQQSYSESELLRNQAEQFRKDNAGDF